MFLFRQASFSNDHSWFIDGPEKFNIFGASWKILLLVANLSPDWYQSAQYLPGNGVPVNVTKIKMAAVSDRFLQPLGNKACQIRYITENLESYSD